MIVLDTTVVSELMRQGPDPQVVAWIRAHAERGLVATTVTVAEIGYGIEGLPSGRRRETLALTAQSQFAGFGRQILAFDLDAAEQYPQVVVARERVGRPIGELDAQIAAIALASGAAVATRNVEDFVGVGIEVLDPWMA